jgi:MATE family multidrug resistance protein
MMNLALPGLLMLITEFLAFEILTIVSSYISSTALASQSVLSTLSIVTFQIPFPVSIAGSTRLANLIGAGLADAGKICIKVNMTIAVFAGVLNMILLTGFREYIPKLFTDDKEVARLILDVIPLFVVFQLFDALTANCNGILRGLGRQSIGGWVNILCYYLVSLQRRWGRFVRELTEIADRNAHILQHSVRAGMGPLRTMAWSCYWPYAVSSPFHPPSPPPFPFPFPLSQLGTVHDT